VSGTTRPSGPPVVHAVRIPAGAVTLDGDLAVPTGATGIILFAHGSGSSRHSPRNRYVAERLRQAGLATLLFDLLTWEEERVDERTRKLRFDIGLLTDRLLDVTEWVRGAEDTRSVEVGYFGASTGAAAALLAAARGPHRIGAVVSRGGRPDLAGPALGRVRAATLLIVGGLDHEVMKMNRDAFRELTCEKRLEIVPGATHLFQEEGALERVAQLAADWFAAHLG
jgi:putative phosphoribosyl transferase